MFLWSVNKNIWIWTPSSVELLRYWNFLATFCYIIIPDISTDVRAFNRRDKSDMCFRDLLVCWVVLKLILFKQVRMCNRRIYITIGDEDRMLTLMCKVSDFWVYCLIWQYWIMFLVMSSTSLFGVLGEFGPYTDLFTTYLDRLWQFYIANSIGQCDADASQQLHAAADKKKIAVFISVKPIFNLATLFTRSENKNPATWLVKIG